MLLNKRYLGGNLLSNHRKKEKKILLVSHKQHRSSPLATHTGVTALTDEAERWNICAHNEIYTEYLKPLRYFREHSDMIDEELNETFTAHDDSISFMGRYYDVLFRTYITQSYIFWAVTTRDSMNASALDPIVSSQSVKSELLRFSLLVTTKTIGMWPHSIWSLFPVFTLNESHGFYQHAHLREYHYVQTKEEQSLEIPESLVWKLSGRGLTFILAKNFSLNSISFSIALHTKFQTCVYWSMDEGWKQKSWWKSGQGTGAEYCVTVQLCRFE